MEHISSFVPGQAKGFFSEFKAFAMKGNAIDLAVGIIIGLAFNAIINSLVNDIVMPLIATIFGKPDFSAIVIGQIQIGNFITSVINFLIIGLSVFMVVKYIFKRPTSPADVS